MIKMIKLNDNTIMSTEDIAFDMIQLGVYSIGDIKQYGFNDAEAKAIQEEINKR